MEHYASYEYSEARDSILRLAGGRMYELLRRIDNDPTSACTQKHVRMLLEEIEELTLAMESVRTTNDNQEE